MSGPALSGGVTAATAQGHLPQYRGTAAASFPPVLSSYVTLDRDQPTPVLVNYEQPMVANGSVAVAKPPSLLSENRPLSRAIPIVCPNSNSLNAASYMRQLNQKQNQNPGVGSNEGADC